MRQGGESFCCVNASSKCGVFWPRQTTVCRLGLDMITGRGETQVLGAEAGLFIYTAAVWIFIEQ